jgi:hypothetical protein
LDSAPPTPPSLPGLPALTCMGTLPKVWETFELNQLKSAHSQVLPGFFTGFDRLQTCCHQFEPANILIILFLFQVINFFFIVMTT